MEDGALSIEAYFRREMTAIGVPAVEQISLMHVLVVGLRGCGMEIAKCLAMSGVQRLTLLDDELVREEDLSLSLLVRDGDQGKPKAKLLASRLNERAPFADVRTLSGALSLDLLFNFHVVVFAGASVSQEEVVAYDEFCRAQEPPIGVVSVESRGLFGSVFTDFSRQHQCLNTTPGSADVEFSVLARRTQVHTDDRIDAVTITVKEPLVRAYIEPGDHVTLQRSRSDTSVLSLVVERVVSDRSLLLRPLDLEACGRSEMQRRLSGEFRILRRVATRISTASHRSLRECLVAPGPIMSPTRILVDDPRRSASLHMAMLGVHAFRQEFGVFPSSNNSDHIAESLVKITELLDRNGMYVTSNPANALSKSIQMHDVDESLMERALRCASAEFLPLSALIAGFAALQVLKYSGALGTILYPPSQFLYFDVLDELDESQLSRLIVPPPRRRDVSLAAILGSAALSRVQSAVPVLIGAGATNMEVLKNLLCTGVGASASIQIVLDQNECPTISASDLHARILFEPPHVGQQKTVVLDICHERVKPRITSDDFQSMPPDLWEICSVIIVNSRCIETTLMVDKILRAFEKPALHVYEDTCGFQRVDTVCPHTSATFCERLIDSAHKNNPQIFAFDHLPKPPALPEVCPRLLLPSERLAQTAHDCFEVIFQTSIQVAAEYFERRLPSRKSPELNDFPGEDDDTLWMVWSVAQRGHGVDNFGDCLRVAWLLLELLPTWLRREKKSVAIGESNEEVPEVVEQQGMSKKGSILAIDLDDLDQLQLLIATACIIASSVSIKPPPVQDRRPMLLEVASMRDSFSLHTNPRTTSGIQQSFFDVDASRMLYIVSKVTSTRVDFDTAQDGHLHFLQSLTNLQLRWQDGEAPSRIATLPHLRRLCRKQREFLPVATILGALCTVQLMRIALRGGAAQREDLREYVASSTPTGSSVLLNIDQPPAPLFVTSMASEITRGVPLRMIPDKLSRWTKIVLPTSVEMQSLKSIVRFVETKFAITIHAIYYQHQKIATVTKDAMTNADGVLKPSVFDLIFPVSPPPSFVLLDVVAVDATGDVVLAPLRVNRKTS